jgi:hypothetical protein
MPLLSWRYVRPGLYAWLDKNGNNVTVAGDQKWGEATLHLTDSPHGVKLVVEPAQRLGPILKPETPWEQDGFPALSTILRDGDKFRAWGSIGSWGDLKDRGQAYFCYFESDDGLHWRRPDCGIVDYQGSRANNLLASEGGTVFIDPAAPAEERYKWILAADFAKEQVDAYQQSRHCGIDAKAYRSDVKKTFGVKGAVSPDGLHWTTLAQPLALMHADTQLVAYYDPALKKFVGYFRDWAVDATAATHQEQTDPNRWIGIGRRAIGRAETSDFREFPLSETILEPQPWLAPSQVLYTNCRTSFPGAPDQHLMFPAVWDQSTDRTHLRVAASRDGRAWDWLAAGEPPPFETAPAGAWDGGCVFASPNLLELPDGTFALPYTGYDVPHKFPRRRAKRATGYATWPKGRLAGIRAEAQGEFATIAVVPPGKKLLINAITSEKGSITIEAADLSGQPLPGRSFADAVPLTGDCHLSPVRWKQHDDLGDADAVMLRVKMNSATVYFFELAATQKSA